eukprot:m.88222 g.88222  ORF g.88222 m.88222 type:complete len:201 (+) comp12260_c1_seq6:2-604(+)
MLTSAMLMLIGDTVAQYLETEEKTEDLGSKKFMIVTPNNLFPNGFKIDPTRSVVLALWAGSMGGLFTSWFRFMDRIFCTWPRFSGVIGKVTLTSFGLSPFTNAAFLSMVTVVEHVVMKHERDATALAWAAQDKLDDEFTSTLVGSWSFWVPVNFVSWMYLPSHLRVAFGGVAAMVWNVYLSIVQHRKHRHHSHAHSNETS